MSEFVLPNFPTDVLQGIGTTDMQYICILKTVMTVWYIFSSTTSIAWLLKRVDHPKQQKTGESEVLGYLSLHIRVRWTNMGQWKTSGHTFSYVKLNFNMGLFSWIFFEAVFRRFTFRLFYPLKSDPKC